MERPLICFDIESTGTNPATDKIITLALRSVGSLETARYIIVNPGIPIPKEATEVHGITDDMVAGLPPFSAFANDIHECLKDADVLGFNLTNFDIPILWEEFYRCGIDWDLSETKVIDVGVLFKKREERTLAAAVQFYCGREHGNAHDAMSDVGSTIDVFEAQLLRYKLGGLTREQLMAESNYEEKRVDLAGKIIIGKDGRPTYNIGKAKGVAVEDDPGFGCWMLNRDFSENTKMHLNRILYPETPVGCSSDASDEGNPF